MLIQGQNKVGQLKDIKGKTKYCGFNFLLHYSSLVYKEVVAV